MPYRTTFDPTTRIWSGQPEQPLYSANASVATVCLAGLALNPDHIAQISDSDGSRMTNGELRQLAVRIALNLRLAENVQRGDVIGVVANNHRLVAPAVLGSIAVAAPLNVVDVHCKRDEFVHMFGLTRPKVIFCDAHVVPVLRQALEVIGAGQVAALYTVDQQVADAKFIEDLCVPSDDPDAEELFQVTSVGDGTRHAAFIASSSGTTGRPKGVTISHAMILQQMVYSAGDITADDRVLTVISLYWVSSIVILLSALQTGVTRIITAITPITPDTIIRLVDEYGITGAMITPAVLVDIMRSPQVSVHKLRTLRSMYWAGGGMPAHLMPLCNSVLPVPVRGVYGMTELGGKVASATLATAHTGSAGQLSSGMSVQVLRDLGDDHQQTNESTDKTVDRRCGPGEVGEIRIRSSLPLLGYWGDEAAVSADGWFNTGDIGYFDGAGNLFIVDRKKEILRCRNVQVSPAELEDVVRQLPGVADVCVVGVPDELPGNEMPTAVVVRMGSEAGERLRAEDVIAIVAERLAPLKALRGGVWFAERMPVTPSGKLMRRVVKEWVLKWRAEAKA